MINSSGIGRYIRSLVPIFQGKRVKVICYKEDAELLLKYFTLDDLLFASSGIYSIYEQLEVLKFKKNDLFWSPHYNIPILRKGNQVTTVHDVVHLALREIFDSNSMQVYAKFMFNMVAKKSGKIICVSNFTKSEFVKYTRVNADKIKVIHNGLEEAWYQVKKVKRPSERPYILFVGNIKPHKNLMSLITAYIKVLDKLPHDLILVGEKEGFLKGDKKIAELVSQGKGRIKFTGFVDEFSLQQYYAFADLFVFPSLYEGFGYPPLEAMACGTPVLASNSASIPEVCGNAAEYFNPLDINELSEKIVGLIENESLRAKMINAGSQHSKKFTLEKCTKETISVFEEYI